MYKYAPKLYGQGTISKESIGGFKKSIKNNKNKGYELFLIVSY